MVPTTGLTFAVFRSEPDQEVLVQHHFSLDGEEHGCSAPFSWILALHLESLWEESEFVPGATTMETLVRGAEVNGASLFAPQCRQKATTAGSSSFWLPPAAASWDATSRPSQPRTERSTAAASCRTSCCFPRRSGPRTSSR